MNASLREYDVVYRPETPPLDVCPSPDPNVYEMPVMYSESYPPGGPVSTTEALKLAVCPSRIDPGPDKVLVIPAFAERVHSDRVIAANIRRVFMWLPFVDLIVRKACFSRPDAL